MAASKKNKKVKQGENPGERSVIRTENPDAYYYQHPAWSFADADNEEWALSKTCAGDVWWDGILPKLKEWERVKWKDVLIGTNNHLVDVQKLNPCARKRILELRIEQESLVSLRFQGVHRIYGYMVGNVFHIVWYDPNHGDNDACVCRSHKKHT